jgi:hypothetical protein
VKEPLNVADYAVSRRLPDGRLRGEPIRASPSGVVLRVLLRRLSAGLRRPDGTLRLWDAASGETLGVLEGHRFTVLSCVLSPDGSRLAPQATTARCGYGRW